MNNTLFFNQNQEANCNLILPTFLNNFNNTSTVLTLRNQKEFYIFYGSVNLNNSDRKCPHCGRKMHINNTRKIEIHHLNIGSTKSLISVDRKQLYCNNCHISKMQKISFMDEHHHITIALKNYIENLLEKAKLTLVQVSMITGINKNIIKEIDKERLLRKYTDKGKKLKKPVEKARYLGIDEFSLHKGFKYATHIVNLETGHILWIAEGKRKAVVYDFMKFVGKRWMRKVKAVACDMNSDFCEAFVEKYPHIKIVFDYFHIVKNFNDLVVNEIYKEEKIKLKEEGKITNVDDMKFSKYILFSNKKNLKKKDKKRNKKRKKKSKLFKKKKKSRTKSLSRKYNGLIKNNEILILLDVIKEELRLAYQSDNTYEMEKMIKHILSLCEENGHSRLIYFKRLIERHYEGIINHAKYKISTGPVEGINNKIKTLRRTHYGLPDDDYFFLKVIDCSYKASN